METSSSLFFLSHPISNSPASHISPPSRIWAPLTTSTAATRSPASSSPSKRVGQPPNWSPCLFLLVHLYTAARVPLSHGSQARFFTALHLFSIFPSNLVKSVCGCVRLSPCSLCPPVPLRTLVSLLLFRHTKQVHLMSPCQREQTCLR